MSELTGYLTPTGIDLSYIFHNINNRTFTNQITTDIGIKGPSSGITYSAGMIGYVEIINARALNIAITNGTIINLTNVFSLGPGLYLCICFGYNVYNASTGRVSNFYLGVSSSSTNTSTDGFWVNISQTISLPNNSLRFIVGTTFRPLKVETTTNFYLIQQIDFATVTVTNAPNALTQTYFKYVRVA